LAVVYDLETLMGTSLWIVCNIVILPSGHFSLLPPSPLSLPQLTSSVQQLDYCISLYFAERIIDDGSFLTLAAKQSSTNLSTNSIHTSNQLITFFFSELSKKKRKKSEMK